MEETNIELRNDLAYSIASDNNLDTLLPRMYEALDQAEATEEQERLKELIEFTRHCMYIKGGIWEKRKDKRDYRLNRRMLLMSVFVNPIISGIIVIVAILHG